MNKPTKRSLPVSALVTIVAAFAIPARAEGPVARVPAVQENSTDPDLKAMFDNWRASTLFNDRQRALLAYVDQAARGDVDDATFAAFEKFFDTQEIVEITITVDTYVGTALFTRALRIKIEDDGRLTAIGKC